MDNMEFLLTAGKGHKSFLSNNHYPLKEFCVICIEIYHKYIEIKRGNKWKTRIVQ